MKKTVIAVSAAILCIILCSNLVSCKAEREPLSFTTETAVPDFLTEEQQRIYREADFLYCHMFGGETSGIDAISVEDISADHENDMIEKNGMQYTRASGKYQRWDDFEDVIHSVFTDDFWQKKNCISEDISIYVEHEGALYYIDASRGSGYYYNRYFEDEFELVSKTDKEISFKLIGHYSENWKKENETSEQRELRLKNGYDYTVEFPMKLVLTEDGWRFAEFHSALADELPPELPEIFDNVGKTLGELKREYPEGKFAARLDGFPDAAAACFEEPGEEYVCVFFGGQSGDFEKAMDECEERIKCAGLITTARVLFPDMEDEMSFGEFFSLIGVDDYEYLLGEDVITGEGWLRFSYHGMEVMVNTNEASAGGGWNFTGAEIVKRNAPVSIVDPEILHTNQDFAEAVMFD